MSVSPATADLLDRWHHACNGPDMDVLLAIAHPAIEIRPDPQPLVVPAGTSYHGHDGLRSAFAQISAAFPEIRNRTHAYRAVGGHTAVPVSLTPNRSAPFTTLERILLYTIEDEQILRVQSFTSEADALRAAREPRGRALALLDEAVAPMLLVDDEGRVTDANGAAAALFGAGSGELAGRRLLDLLAVSGAAGWARGWQELTAHGHASGEILVEGPAARRRVRFWCTAGFLPGRHLVLLHPLDAAPRAAAGGVLTAREREVLELLAAGLTAPQVADELVLSPATVRTHVQNAMGRLGARTRVHAIVMALALGEIAPRGALDDVR
jgi:DNA-binding CsgD family transcriptional regulator